MNKTQLLTLIAFWFTISMYFFLVSEPHSAPALKPVECQLTQGPGDIAHYEVGLHQIWQGDLLSGSDDVYTRDYGFLQCFCDPEGNGIQTTWVESELGDTNGSQWNLGDKQYIVENTNYSCNEPVPTPTSTPKPEVTPAPKAPPEWEDPCFYVSQDCKTVTTPTPLIQNCYTTKGGIEICK